MKRSVRVISALLSIALALAGCGKKDDGKSATATKFPAAPPQSELVKLKTEGPLPAARKASALEFWLHYKLMRATGMEQALGGEDKAIAALKAVSMKFEQSAIVAQTNVPRAAKLDFDGTGMDAGVMGAGYGLIGGVITGGMLSGGLSNEQIAEAAKHGPIKFDDGDGSAQVDIAQDGMSTKLEQTVNESGVTGKVKTEIHIDACPDAEGKLVVTIETQSQMGAGGKSEAVTLRYRQERYLDDDAHLLPVSDGDKAQAAEFFQIDMKGSGANGDLSYYEDNGFTSDGKPAGGTQRHSGYSFFRPDEARHTEKLVEGTENVMRAFAQMMLDGTLGSKLTNGSAPWESGRCVDLKLRSTPEKRSGAQPKTHYTVFAEPRAKKDGAPTGGTVKATLKGPHSLSPQDKVKADAQFEYQNPEEKDQRATIDFEARSKRGVGKASLEFDTKKGGYRIVVGGGDPVSQVVCDIDHSFVLNGKMFGTEFSGGMDGTYKLVRTLNIPGLQWKASGTYHIDLPNGPGAPGTLSIKAREATTRAGKAADQNAGYTDTFTLTPVTDCK